MGEARFRVVFASELYRVRPILAEAMAYVKGEAPNIARQDETDLRLIFSELLYNAVIHGNKHDGAKTVHMELSVHEDTVYLQVADEGAGFDYRRVIDGFSRNPDENLYKENGRGIRLVCSIAESVEFNERGNEVRVSKCISAHG